MTSFPSRKSHRLTNYNYAKSGAYFITVCVKNGRELFWRNKAVGAASGRPPLNDLGVLVEAGIKKISSIYRNVNVDKYVVMPNHVHMILVLSEMENEGGRPVAAPTISRILNQWKGFVSKQAGFSVWQKLYYDHLIRDESDYRRIWEYIDNNPQKWEQDLYHP